MKVMVIIPQVCGSGWERNELSIVVPHMVSETAARKACRKAGYEPVGGQTIRGKAVRVRTYLYDSQDSIDVGRREDSGRVYAMLQEFGKHDDEFVVERVVKVKPWSLGVARRSRADER
jgi:hypothetical protein